MTRLNPRKRTRERADVEDLFERANAKWENGEVNAAFRLFLAAAKRGDSSAQVNLGNFYAHGVGVKPNRNQALYWYRKAYQQGQRCAASNIGIVFRDEHKLNQALKWFKRAVNLGDGDANLEIAKIYLGRSERDLAVHFLEETVTASAGDVTEASREEADRLLRQLRMA